jgi:hypothetical protein
MGALQNWLLADPSLQKILNISSEESHMHFYYIKTEFYSIKPNQIDLVDVLNIPDPCVPT